MAKAIDVATYLIRLADVESEPDPLSHLRLQKLLYYVQGWSLALRKSAMFPERIEAWAHGPVVPTVYHEFSQYKSFVIPPHEWPYTKTLKKLEEKFAADVWEVYKEYSATSLRKMTHQEDPWIRTRGDIGPADLCTKPITHTVMKKFFISLSKQ